MESVETPHWKVKLGEGWQELDDDQLLGVFSEELGATLSFVTMVGDDAQAEVPLREFVVGVAEATRCSRTCRPRATESA